MAVHDQPSSEAIQWLLRVRDGDVDWEQLTAWLEADDRNRAAFDRLSVVDQQLNDLRRFDHREMQQSRSRRGWWPAAGITSAVAAAAALAFVLMPPRVDKRFETAAGQSRQIALADGSRLDLNGATVVVINARDDCLVRVERGEVFFQVVHNPNRPFRVQLGNATVEDVGTKFDVLRDGADIELGVKDGAVIFRSGNESIKLTHGMVLSVTHSQAVISRAAAAYIGSWRTGEISYVGASLHRVARDLERTRGVRMEVAPQLSRTSFSGTIQLRGGDADVAKRVAALTGAGVVQTSGGWRLVPHGARGR